MHTRQQLVGYKVVRHWCGGGGGQCPSTRACHWRCWLGRSRQSRQRRTFGKERSSEEEKKREENDERCQASILLDGIQYPAAQQLTRLIGDGRGRALSGEAWQQNRHAVLLGGAVVKAQLARIAPAPHPHLLVVIHGRREISASGHCTIGYIKNRKKERKKERERKKK